MPKKENEAGEVASGDKLTLDEISNGKPIEKAADTDALDAEAFANDVLTIVVSKDASPGAYDVITPNVNGVNQPIVLGMKQKVKRKYVEALARSRITGYDQEVPDPRKPENFTMREITVLTHPFSVLHDPHPKGDAWLQNILSQP